MLLRSAPFHTSPLRGGPTTQTRRRGGGSLLTFARSELRCPPPHPSRQEAQLPPHQGEGWSSLHRSNKIAALRQGSLPRRQKARGRVKEQAPKRRGWRAEKRNLVARALRHAGASRRAISRSLVGTGPRFPLPAMAVRSARSSWQGLLVVPGGAPMPPECRCCVHEPAGAAPRPASRTPHDAPFTWTRCVQSK